MPSLTFIRPEGTPVEVSIQTWSDDPAVGRGWTVVGRTIGAILEQTLSLLAPDTDFRLRREGVGQVLVRSDAQGRLVLRQQVDGTRLQGFELRPVTAQR